MAQHPLTPHSQRERSRSPRHRSRSPRRSSRRSYSPRSRSRSPREYRRERRSRSPDTGAPGSTGGYSGSYQSRGAPPRGFEDRGVAKEQMMQSLRENSQQDRRVYVGNLAYDVKWHHLKDFMRQGEWCTGRMGWGNNTLTASPLAGDVLFADVLLLPNGMSKVG